MTGDLIHDDSREAYQRLKELMGDISAPIHALPGNHDVPALMAEVFKTGPISSPGSFQLGNWQIILLDSSVTGEEGGTLAESELVRLERLLLEQSDNPTLVCVHHPPIPVGSTWLDTMMITNASDLMTSLQRHDQVKALVFGHIHQEYDATENGVRLLGTPSTCVQFLPGSEDFALDNQPPGYRWLRLHDTGQLETGIERVLVTP